MRIAALLTFLVCGVSAMALGGELTGHSLRASFFAPVGADDQAKDLLGENIITNIFELDRRNVDSAAASRLPWSDNYWPYYRGSIAYRYADEEFPRGKSWGTNHQYFIDNNPLDIYADGDPEAMNELSPAEKYDLIMGDQTLAMTRYNWSLGKADFEKASFVDQWMGICEGWAAASVYVPEAHKEVKVPTPTGKVLTLYPSDIHALASLLWTKAAPKAIIIGGRCRTKTPNRDANGRVTEAPCFDTNPGTWHIAATNSIGIRHQSLIIDADYTAEVWNQPVFKYNLTYFNPETKSETATLKRALIPLDAFRHDKFRSFRSAQTASVVGVSMFASYVDETEPVVGAKAHSKVRTVNYVYDLELNASGEILGGEWYSTLHPDFIWASTAGETALSAGDAGLNSADWQEGRPVPESWRRAAAQAVVYGQPLAAFVNRVVEASQ